MANPLRQDPSRTGLLRRAFEAEMRRRVDRLLKAIMQLVERDDVFGLRETTTRFKPVANLERQAWRFLTSSQKMQAFKRWFAKQVQDGLLSTDAQGRPWTARYVDSAFRKGMMRAYTSTHRQEMGQSLDFYQGTQEQFLRSAFMQPERVGKLELINTRVFEDLDGITKAMGQKVGRVLAQGLADGRNPREVARTMAKEVRGISRTRAEVLARTEMIHAHAEGQLDGFEELGVDEVGVQAEWLVTHDDRLCDVCAELEGVVMPVEQARGLLPRHPNCRCAWAPALKTEKQQGQVRGAGAVKQAMKRSVRKEKPGSTYREAKGRSTWLGKEQL